MHLHQSMQNGAACGEASGIATGVVALEACPTASLRGTISNPAKARRALEAEPLGVRRARWDASPVLANHGEDRWSNVLAGTSQTRATHNIRYAGTCACQPACVRESTRRLFPAGSPLHVTSCLWFADTAVVTLPKGKLSAG